MMTAYEKSLEDLAIWMEEADTDPCIAAFFMTTLRERSFPADHPIPDDLQQAVDDQRQIGWDNILFGRLATQWQDLQQTHLSSTKSRRSAERWAADMTYKLLQLSHTLWTTRNGIVHERDQQGLLLAEGQTLREAITTCYSKGRKALLPTDQHFLDRPLQDILAMPATDKYTWLGAITLAHKMAAQARGNEQANMRNSLARYLATGSCARPAPIDSNEE